MPLSIRQGDPAPYLDFDPPRECPLCAGTDHALLSRKMQFGLDCTTVICRSCGFCFVSPAPKLETYQRFYRDGYAQFYRRIHSPIQSTNCIETPSEKQRLDRTEEVRPLAGQNVLEIGPGSGRFLNLVAARGACCSAIEPSNQFRHQLESRGVRIIGDFLETTYVDEPYDVVILFQVLEHFHDPVVALKHIRDNLLHPTGLLVLDVPNIWKPYRSLDRYFLRYVHLSYFSPRTLARLLAQCGFLVKVLDEADDSPFWVQPIFVIAECSEKTSHQDEGDNWAQLLSHLRKYRRRYPIRIAPWLHLRLLKKRIRNILAQSPVGTVYRWVKSRFV